jgi:predicted amidohydrolase YtcJ
MSLQSTRIFIALISSVVVSTVVCAGAQGVRPVADAVYVNGKVVTMNGARHIVQGLAIRDGKIIATGTNKDVRRHADATTKIVDLAGRTVLPGFIDNHAHPQIAIRMQSYVDAHFSVTPSIVAMLERTTERTKVTPVGEWVIVAGSAANTTYYTEKRNPTKRELDDAAPSHPVIYLNGPHTLVANSMALTKMAVKHGEKMQKGAFVELDESGAPNGVIHEGSPLFPELKLPADLLQRYVKEEIPAYFLPRGYTTVTDIMPLPNYDAVREVAATGARMPIRYVTVVFADAGGKYLPKDLTQLMMPPSADPDWFRFAGIKIWLDGDIPVRTGFLLGSYAGEPDAHGFSTNTQEELNTLVSRVHASGLGLFMHCTGDRANVMALDAYEQAQKQGGPKTLMRIEHLGTFMLGPNVLSRAKALDVKAIVTPGWIYTLSKVTVNNLGAAVANAQTFQFKKMIAAGLEPAYGSDLTGFQRGMDNPFTHIQAMVTRRTLEGTVFLPKQAVTIDQALRMMTIWAAKGIGDEKTKGSLEPGKFADMIVLSDDIMTIDPNKISGIKVIETIVGGDRVYQRPPG